MTRFLKRSFSSRDVLLLAFAVLLVNVLVVAVNTSKNLGHPYNTFLVDPAERFSDFFKVIDAFQIVDTWGGLKEGFIYYEHALPVPTCLYFLSAELIFFTGSKYLVFFALFGIVLAAIVVVARRVGNSWTSIALTMLSYPLLFAVDRGNFALMVFFLLLYGLSSEGSARSAIAIALATSFKITPAVFLIPGMTQQRLSGTRIVTPLLWFTGSLLFINSVAILINGYFLTPTMYNPIVLFTKMIAAYGQNHIDRMEGVAYGSSLYMPSVYLAGKLRVLPPFKSYEWVLFIGTVLALCLLVRKQFIGTFRQIIATNKLTFLACISFVLFMPVTADYYLLIMLIPLLLYPRASYSFGYLVTYGFLLGAKNYPYIDNINGFFPVSLQIFINPILLLVLLFAEFDLIGFIRRESTSVSVSKNRFITFLEAVDRRFAAFIKPYKTVLLILLVVSALIGVGLFRKSLNDKEIHNREMGLPIDFDPETYLALNPGLQQFWESVGVHETGPALLAHAEVHYRDFGAKDKWVYRSTFQRIFYPRFDAH